MNKRVIIIASVVVVVLVSYFIVKGSKRDETLDILTEVQSGEFIIDVETTGELEAKNSIKILGPTRLRDYRIYNVAINDIVEEGTVLKKGQWVATLDKSELMSKLQDVQLEVEEMQSQYIQTQLDTALQMRQSRDELINLDYTVQEREIELEQSKFEPPATQRQAEMNLEKAKRGLQQAKENYVIKRDQNVEKMKEVSVNLRKAQRELNDLMTIQGQFVITAPEDGMVIYRKGFDGLPIKQGSTISAWDPAVAELPDLSIMLSKTYVNEVDVRKITNGQDVEIGLDAFPDKRMRGRVIRVANVGEQRPNSDAKVFQVNVQVFGTDDLLRPAMTTSNRIITQVIDSANYIPLECLHSKNDSITFVYKKEGINIVKQEVNLGPTNSNSAVILAGVNTGDRLYLSVPNVSEEKEINLLPELDGKRMKKEPKYEDIEIPEENTFTLPDGRVVQRPAGGGRPGQGARPAQGGAQKTSADKGTENKESPKATSETEKSAE